MKKAARATKPQANDAASFDLLRSLESVRGAQSSDGLVVSSFPKAVRTLDEMIGGSEYLAEIANGPLDSSDACDGAGEVGAHPLGQQGKIHASTIDEEASQFKLKGFDGDTKSWLRNFASLGGSCEIALPTKRQEVSHLRQFQGSSLSVPNSQAIASPSLTCSVQATR